MELLDFARGPALQISLAILVFGILWRLVSLFLLPRTKDKTPARKGAPLAIFAATKEIFMRSWPGRYHPKGSMLLLINAYIFHLGIAVVVVAFAPHVLFFQDLFGFSWPSLPNNVIYAVGVITLGSMVAGFVNRLSSPVLRFISGFDDYISWLVTFLPVLTGLLASSHLGAPYETLLAIHILSVEAFLIWLPFGKLMHMFLVFVTRAQIGAHLSHRGVKL